MQAKCLKILLKKDVRKIESSVGRSLDGLLLLESNGKIWVASRDIENLDLSRLRVQSIGMYFGEMRSGSFHLSRLGKDLVSRI